MSSVITRRAVGTSGAFSLEATVEPAGIPICGLFFSELNLSVLVLADYRFVLVRLLLEFAVHILFNPGGSLQVVAPFKVEYRVVRMN